MWIMCVGINLQVWGHVCCLYTTPPPPPPHTHLQFLFAPLIQISLWKSQNMLEKHLFLQDTHRFSVMQNPSMTAYKHITTWPNPPQHSLTHPCWNLPTRSGRTERGVCLTIVLSKWALNILLKLKSWQPLFRCLCLCSAFWWAFYESCVRWRDFFYLIFFYPITTMNADAP